jgi:ABC-type bacteriocin/lantibiotic exporter with double-glycine peptidase domain
MSLTHRRETSSNLNDQPNAVVFIQGGSFKWGPEAENPILRNINVEIKTGTLVAIVGTVGAGKSALLECILGEMEKVSGQVCCLRMS